MQNFRFQTVPLIINETGALARLGEFIQQEFPACRRLFIVSDAGLVSSGILQAGLDNLDQLGLQYQLYAGVVPDPPEAVVLLAAQQAREFGSDLVIGMGGGSAMDVAKLIAVLCGNDQALSTMYGINQIRGQRLPLVQIPTTAGTGSEVTNISIVTTGETTKMGVVAPQLFADLAILDASLTTGLPVATTAATGIDAMVHAIEAYTTRHKKNPVSDMLARQALKLLFNHIDRACSHGRDLAARQAMLLGAMMAGQAFANAPCAAVHALAYPIGGRFHVPHGLSNSLVLPTVLRFNLPAASEQYAELAEILAPDATGSAEARANAMINALADLALRTGIPTRLRQVGIRETDLEQLASDAMQQTRLLGNNPREVSWQDAYEIYAAVL